MVVGIGKFFLHQSVSSLYATMMIAFRAILGTRTISK